MVTWPPPLFDLDIRIQYHRSLDDSRNDYFVWFLSTRLDYGYLGCIIAFNIRFRLQGVTASTLQLLMAKRDIVSSSYSMRCDGCHVKYEGIYNLG